MDLEGPYLFNVNLTPHSKKVNGPCEQFYRFRFGVFHNSTQKNKNNFLHNKKYFFLIFLYLFRVIFT